MGHVLDPRSGRPVDLDGSVTVIAPRAAEADALSTGLFVMGVRSGLEWVEKYRPDVAVCFIVNPGSGFECEWSQKFEQHAGKYSQSLAVR
jgi:FAD:protein FMN transferase